MADFKYGFPIVAPANYSEFSVSISKKQPSANLNKR